jgi:hypothetical protein
MRAFFFAAVMTLTIGVGSRAQRTANEELNNVSAFARLYGVVRYFYPSDAAASLDWNRFAVHGIGRVRAVENAKALETTLNSLFAPLGPGIRIGAALPPPSDSDRSNGSLIAWRYLGPGFTALRGPSPYKAKRLHRTESSSTSIDGFVTMMQSIAAEPLRGRTVRLRGQARVKAPDMTGSGAFWLRVDRPDRSMGFFDNMGDRPIREPQWREYSIEGVVAGDAANVAFGVMASGSATADFDRIELSTRDEDGGWRPVQIADAGFEAVADSRTGGWFRAGTSQTAAVTRSSGDAPEGRQFVRLAPGGTVPASTAELFDGAPPTAGAHIDVDLGAGLNARVPLVLSESEATTDAARSTAIEALLAAIAQDHNPGDGFDNNLRLADVVVAWNVFRHFYPYWAEAAVDWDARLRPQLEDALRATTREGQRNALRRLVADARDGHGGVADTRQADRPAVLPIQLAAVEERVVVTASDVPADAPVGAVVSTIDRVPAVQRLAEATRLASGTPQWKRARALQEMVMCAKGAVITIGLDTAAGPRQAALHCDAGRPAMEKRPGPVVEVQPGVWYVDLTRAQNAQVSPVLEQIARATGVVFDVRGYPTDAGAAILSHLIDAPEQDLWMHVAKIVGPFGQSAGWQSVGWNMTPGEPRIRGKVVFMTDGRAISYAESVMGYVADRKLGTIVGGTTAGTNGNVAVFSVPSGFQISFTGMRVTRHDGRSPFHLIGVAPNIPVSPTVAAIREGRDIVLERALELVRGK